MYAYRVRARCDALLFGLCCALAADLNHAATTIRAEVDGDFHEVVQEEVSVSGTVVVGVAASGALSGPATLAGLIIPSSTPRVCLTVISRDGVYYSRNTYRVPTIDGSDEDTVVFLPFEATQRRDLIASYALGELAVRATPGGCEEDASIYLVASAQPQIDSVDVLINAFGANSVYYRTTDGVEADCREFTQGRRTSYDYECNIPAGALGKGRQEIFIERERYGRPLREVKIELQITSGR